MIYQQEESNSDLLQLVGLAGDGSHNRKAF